MCQVYSVLDKYDKSYSNSGVLANLECWQNNKGWLVELLRHHSNWNEEALAVIFEVTHSREIDKYTINSYKYELSQLIYNLDLLEDDGTSLFSPLMLFLYILQNSTRCGYGCSCKTAKRRSLLCGTENQPNY